MVDFNDDGLNDEFIADITFNSAANDIKDLQLFVFFDYAL